MKLWSSWRLALGFLTRLPVAAERAPAAQMARACAWFPLVGLLLGLLLAALAQTMHYVLPASLTAWALVAALALVTGGLHLDGLADTFDGLGAGGTPERMLRAMRDPRLGAHGTSAMVLLLLGKQLALWTLIQGERWVALVWFPSVARGVLVLALFWLRRHALSASKATSSALLAGSFVEDAPHTASHAAIHSSPPSMGEALRTQIRWRDALIASAWFIPAFWWPQQALWPAVLSLACGILFAETLYRRLRGFRGDACGALIECAELAFLLAACGINSR